MPDGGVPPVLAVTGATKSFAGVTVLHDVDLSIPAGTVRSIVGHNGSGKSTLVKLLSGFYPLEGDTRVSIDGREIHLTGHTAAHAAGLRFVHQDLGLAAHLSAVDNLAFGARYPRRRTGLIDWKRAERRTTQLLGDLGYDVDVTAPVGLLSPGGRTGVALARALQDGGGTARVLVLDEPTAAMSKAEFDELAEVIGELTARGLSVVYISHHLDEVLQLGGEVSVLRDGRLVATRPTTELSGPELVTLMIGREFVAPTVAAADRAAVDAPMLVQVSGFATRGVDRLDVEVRRGEIVGITGSDGSGRENVAGALAGLLPRAGTLHVDGVLVPSRSPRAAVRAGMGCTLADRQSNGLLPTLSAGWNLSVTGVSRYRRFGLLSRREERRDARSWMARLGVLPSREELPVRNFSGGNQQKVMLGRWLRNAPMVLLLEEPTQGVDVAAQQDIHRQVRDAAEAGAAVIVCSSDAGELVATCHRVLVMRSGTVVAELAGDTLTVDRIESTTLWQEESA